MGLANKTVPDYTKVIHGRASTMICQKVINLGIPGLWLYYRALGLESAFFNLLQNVPRDVTQVKELLYGIDLVNQAQEFFPSTPKGLLKLELPKDVQAAQIVPQKSDTLAYVFDEETMLSVLKEIMKPGVMLVIGNHYRSIGLTQESGKYYLFNVDYELPPEFSNLSLVSQHIMHYLAGNNPLDQKLQALIIQTLNLPNTVKLTTLPEILTRLLSNSKLADDYLKEGLRFAVEAGDKQQVSIYQQAGVPLNLNYMGDLNLLYIAWRKTHGANDMFKFLLQSQVTLTTTQYSLLEDVLPDSTFTRFISMCNKSKNRPSNSR